MSNQTNCHICKADITTTTSHNGWPLTKNNVCEHCNYFCVILRFEKISFIKVGINKKDPSKYSLMTPKELTEEQADNVADFFANMAIDVIDAKLYLKLSDKEMFRKISDHYFDYKLTSNKSKKQSH